MTDGQVPETPQKPATGIWIWVAVGCLGILVMGAVGASLVSYFIYGKAREVAREMEEDPVAATARLIASVHPEIELVATDEANGTVTFRNTETGEEFTVDFEDIEEGRLSFSSDDKTAELDIDVDGDEGGRMVIRTDEGTTTFEAGAGLTDMPDWIPLYPGTDARGTFSSESPEARTAAFAFETDDSVDEVASFYVSALEAEGFTIASRTITPEGALVIAESEGESRSATVTASAEDGHVEVVVHFTEKL